MWLSRQIRRQAPAAEEIRTADVQTAALRLADDRDEALQLACPGGFLWKPSAGDQLLVLKDLAIGSNAPCPVELAPGECCLFAGTSYIHLTADGRVVLHGQVECSDETLLP